jgi:hypothetical protein
MEAYCARKSQVEHGDIFLNRVAAGAQFVFF